MLGGKGRLRGLMVSEQEQVLYCAGCKMVEVYGSPVKGAKAHQHKDPKPLRAYVLHVSTGMEKQRQRKTAD